MYFNKLEYVFEQYSCSEFSNLECLKVINFCINEVLSNSTLRGANFKNFKNYE